MATRSSGQPHGCGATQRSRGKKASAWVGRCLGILAFLPGAEGGSEEGLKVKGRWLLPYFKSVGQVVKWHFLKRFVLFI